MTKLEALEALIAEAQVDLTAGRFDAAVLERDELAHRQPAGAGPALRSGVSGVASEHAIVHPGEQAAPGATDDDPTARVMTAPHQALYAEALADLAAGRLDAGVLKLGEIAYQEPAGALETAQAAALPLPSADTLVHALVHAREQAARCATEERRCAPPSPAPRRPVRRLLVRAAAVLAYTLALLGLLSGLAQGTHDAGIPAPGLPSEPAGPVAAEAPLSAEPPSLPAARAAAGRVPAAPGDPAAEPPAATGVEPCVSTSGVLLPLSSWLCRGQVIHGAAPDAAPDAAPAAAQGAAREPATAPAAPFRTVSTLRLGMPKRIRYETSILVAPGASRDQLAMALADAARQTFRGRPDATAVGVFAFSSPALVGQGWDRGRALASRDGLGWTGDRTFTPVAPGLADTGRIVITLGSALTPGEEIEVDR